jgi:N-acetylglucosaminyldiphosphoundecaprenol N-acetyl-beta-D-mannosaminyltransferase
MLNKQSILGVGITNETKTNILEHVLKVLHAGGKKLFITTPNPEILVYAQKHLSYRDKLNSADIALPDGVGLMLASKLMAKGLIERFTGVDFIEELCKVSREPRFNRGEKPLSMGFLGGRGRVAERTAECLKVKYPWIEVGFVGESWSGGVPDAGPVGRHPVPMSSLRSGHSNGDPTSATRSASIDILFVAYGFPKQEEWIYDNLDRLPVKAAMGVGGAFDYISGSVPRAPKVMRNIGLEWLFRLLIQPWRLKRQLALLTFLRLVIAQRFIKQ